MSGPLDGALLQRATLGAHPAEAAGPVSSISALVTRTQAAALNVSYEIRGDLARVRVPTTAARRIAERLWEHTCCELFIRADSAVAYHELNFSPSGEWTAYAFERYRDGRLVADAALDPCITLREKPDALELSARILLERLSPSYADATLAIGLSAVIEAGDGSRAHWALAHPAQKPDFHHPDSFVLNFDAPRH
jgi:hypothetical protein